MRRNKKNPIKKICAWVCLIIGIVGSLYVGGWVMFIQSIIEACRHFDAGTLTGIIVGVTILKCIFASTVGILIFYAGVILFQAISYKWKR
jgi:hypothetical protein